MPIVTDKTERYLVKAVVEEDGTMVQKQWKCPSLNHMAGLHPSFAGRSTNYFRHRVKYRQPDGTLRGRVRKPHNDGDRLLHIERINWIQDGAKRRKKADR